MRVVICLPGVAPHAWIAAFACALPEADVVAFCAHDTEQADYAVVLSPGEQLFMQQRQLKAVFNLAAGVDALLALANLPLQVPVVRLSDAGMAVQMAEYVCQAVSRFARGLAQFEAEMKQGIWSARIQAPRHLFPVGVMGLGAIGARVARALASFEYPVVGWAKTPKQLPGIDTYVGLEQLDEFLGACRILVCALPLTPETRGILCRQHLEKLQPEGYLINVGRGGHLIEADLLALLAQRRLAGATLDVFEIEPLPCDHALRQHAAITLTPHISALTVRDEAVAQIAAKIRRLQAHLPIDGVVSRQRGY